MSFLIDNANIWYVLFAMVGLGFGAAWWVNRRPKLLLGFGAAVGLIAGLWLLTSLVMTDRKQLELIIHELADAAVEGKADVFQKHLAKDFQLQGHDRQAIVDKLNKAAKGYQVYDIYISGFDVEEMTATTAKAYFLIAVRTRRDEQPFLIAGRGLFIKEEGHWKLKEPSFYHRVGNQPIHLPID